MSFLLKRHAALPSYTPGEHAEGEGFIRLNTNESPYPPSPGVAAAVAGEIGSLQYYNDPDCTQIRRALAQVYGVEERCVSVGNGSDELLYLAFMAFADGEHPICLPDVTYGYYDLFAAALGIPLKKLPLREDFTVDVGNYLDTGCMIVLTNPNAPTGYALSVAQIEEILRANPDQVVLIDEAYIDFGAESCLRLIGAYENLLIVRTFSKSRSMAGARIGFAFGSPRIIADLETMRNAVNLYSVNRMSQAAGVAACRENEYYMENCRRIIEAREYTIGMLREQGFDVLDSLGNFVFARPRGMGAAALKEQLAVRGILVRHWNEPRVKDYLRITIGTMQQMQALDAAIEMIFGRA